MNCSPKKLRMESTTDMAAVLKMAHKYDVPDLMLEAKHYLLSCPTIQVRKSTRTHPDCFLIKIGTQEGLDIWLITFKICIQIFQDNGLLFLRRKIRLDTCSVITWNG